MRHGYLEEAYFTYSYSPIRDETGGVAGVFTAVTETTDRVLNERRLRTVRELGDISAVTAEMMQQACDAALAVLARSRADIPFASIYLFNAENAEGVARRAAFFGMIDDPRIVPAELDPDRDDQPLWAVLSSAPAQRSRVLTGLAADYPGLFTPTGGPMGDAAPDATPAGEVTVTLSDSGDGALSWSFPTPGSASRRRSNRCCSSASTGSAARTGAATRVPGSGWPWWRGWPPCTKPG